MKPRLYRMLVQTYVVEADDWTSHGSVLLPMHATREAVEHACVSVGVYAPRGLDKIRWHTRFALIRDASGEPIVRLFQVQRVVRLDKDTSLIVPQEILR